MCIGSKPSIPAPPPPPPAPTPAPPTPVPPSESGVGAAVEQRQARRAAANVSTGGRRSTVLTSGLGLTTSASSGARKTLLGQ